MSVFLSNLDDFIAPGQACVNPLVKAKIDESSSAKSSTAKRITLETDYSTTEFDFEIAKPLRQEPNLIRSTAKSSGKVATVSLNDCLACSGCVTSAETLLIQQQSYASFMAKLSEVRSQGAGLGTSASASASASTPAPVTVTKPVQVVVAISPQSRASLAHQLQLPSEELFLRVASLLKSLGASFVVDTSSGGDLSLLEAAAEFFQRHERFCGEEEEQEQEQGGGGARDGSKGKMPWVAPQTSTAVSSTRINLYDYGGASTAVRDVLVGAPVSDQEHRLLPMIISSCPGWVCYAEKTHPQALPYLSTAKSAQQALGAVFKRFFAGTGAGASDIYMVSVQPCFDKKLEASRLDFVQSLDADADSEEAGGSSGSSDVDLVISTTELWSLLLDQARGGGGGEGGEADSGAAEAESDVERIVAHLRSFPLDTPPASPRERETDPPSGHLPLPLPLTPRDVEELFRCFSSDGERLVMSSHSGAGSGGFLDFIARRGAERLLRQNLWGAAGGAGGRPDLPLVSGRNADIAEAVLTAAHTHRGALLSEDSHPHSRSHSESEGGGGGGGGVGADRSLRIAKIYGFRHIQSLMLKMKRGKCEYDLIEVMACPSGCVNGGGQIRGAASFSSGSGGGGGGTSESVAEGKDRIAAVEAEYHRAITRRPEESPLARYVYAAGRLGAPLSAAAMSLLHTRYHAVPKLEELAPLAAKW